MTTIVHEFVWKSRKVVVYRLPDGDYSLWIDSRNIPNHKRPDGRWLTDPKESLEGPAGGTGSLSSGQQEMIAQYCLCDSTLEPPWPSQRITQWKAPMWSATFRI